MSTVTLPVSQYAATVSLCVFSVVMCPSLRRHVHPSIKCNSVLSSAVLNTHSDNDRSLIILCFQQDDFLLIHYDKGPCRNKLGHSRASVIWHRTQVGAHVFFSLLSFAVVTACACAHALTCDHVTGVQAFI